MYVFVQPCCVRTRYLSAVSALLMIPKRRSHMHPASPNVPVVVSDCHRFGDVLPHGLMLVTHGFLGNTARGPRQRSPGARLSFLLGVCQRRLWMSSSGACCPVGGERRPIWGARAISASIRQLGQRSPPIGQHDREAGAIQRGVLYRTVVPGVLESFSWQVLLS